ncbi:lytic transglycosylase domain-containing protein [Thermomonas fusca]|uniref:Lytic transglycosylase domain-containing protein n=1 Tax=Thermomonas fusca TaxID=215690 RepID=A0A5R9PG45_9GAMM|nr:lytic transglycosylase domain-containing protein [Thermomonas fusca]TLX22037.1 lytic transglycosylase domain-containing protein [Thermomonas fusca]
MRGRLVSLLLCALFALPLPAFAGGIYKCAGRDGVDSYVSKRLPGAQCKLVGSYRAGRAPKPRIAPQPVAAQPAVVQPMVVATAAAAPVTVAKKASASTPAAPRVVRGQVYSFVDAAGVRNYTSVRPAGLPTASVRTISYSYIEKCYACGAMPGMNFRTLRLNTVAYQDEIRAAAREHGVDEAVVRAIIHAESAFNPRALSRVGAQGLMQLMPATASRFGVANAFDATQNIRGGVRYLAWLLKRFNGNLTLAAAGYNAGEGAVDKYGGVPPYSETQRYVQRVGVLAERYRGVLNPVASPLRGGLSAR